MSNPNPYKVNDIVHFHFPKLNMLVHGTIVKITDKVEISFECNSFLKHCPNIKINKDEIVGKNISQI